MAKRKMSKLPGMAATLSQLFWQRVKTSPDGLAYRSPLAGGGWQSISWGETGGLVRQLAAAFSARGLAKGDRLGVLAPTGLQWELLNLAASGLGLVVVGLDVHGRDDYLDACARGVRLDGVVAEDAATLARLSGGVGAHVKLRVVLRGRAAPGALSWDALLAQGATRSHFRFPQLDPSDAATIVFSSGTTGDPKAISFDHGQLMASVVALLDAMPVPEQGSCTLCWLPMSNLFQRVANAVAIAYGGASYFLAEPRELVSRLSEVHPFLLLGVPRLYEKVYAGMLEQIAARPAWQRRFIAWALDAGAARWAAQQAGLSLPWRERVAHGIAEALVLRPLRQRIFGRSMAFLLSGSAPLAPWLNDAFEAMGMPMIQAYGVSESAVPLTMHRMLSRRVATVGQALFGNELKVAADGEILLRGPGVARDAHVPVDEQGWLHTGDLGRLDAQGFVTLEGRKSEIVKLSTGRRLVPAPIESALQKISLVDQAVVFGAGYKRPVALLTLDENVLAEASRFPEAFAYGLKEDIAKVTADLAPPERPAAVAILPGPFSAERGELTHNLKLRRAAIAQRYGAILAELKERVAVEAGERLSIDWIADIEKKESRDDIAA